jgi:hypothetical protein
MILVMATISNRRRNEASILTSFSISKRNEPAYSRTCKDQSEANLHLRKSEAKRILFIPQIRKIEAEGTLFFPQIGQIEAKRSTERCAPYCAFAHWVHNGQLLYEMAHCFKGLSLDVGLADFSKKPPRRFLKGAQVWKFSSHGFSLFFHHKASMGRRLRAKIKNSKF